MEISSLLLLATTASAVLYDHSYQTTTDITTITLPVNVDEARLDHNNFGAVGIPATDFQGFLLLSNIKLMSNYLTDFPDFCFAGVGTSLTNLNLNDNVLTVIRRDQFKSLYLLQKLWLVNNQIHTLQTGRLFLIYLRANYFAKCATNSFCYKNAIGLSLQAPLEMLAIQNLVSLFLSSVHFFPTSTSYLPSYSILVSR